MSESIKPRAPALDKAYSPKQVEDRVYSQWVDSGRFHADETSSRTHFCIVIPPPNVTGMLTMGHVLNNTLQDILTRFHRMEGHETLWLPGTDHAGIATQNVVEKALAKEKISRHDLGREKFLERVWQWKEKFGGLIIQQLKRLGCSCDWLRERFTMDDGLSRSVRKAFIQLYKAGLIYKGKRIINWCPRCRTALSDEEKIPQDTQGNLWYIRYPLKGEEGHVVVATTRPETMLGDAAVAVNPDDDRFRHLVGKTVILPFLNREIPILADDFVDPKFGTGAVKVTPAHDPNDFEIGLRHQLPQIVVMDESGVMNDAAGPFKGMDRVNCRSNLVKELEGKGLLEKIEDHTLAVGHCQRCNTIIEPYLSDQWFVRMKPLAEKAIAAVKDGTLRFTPARWVNVYLHWMENIRDWCISRQLWWGHRIPAFTCGDCGHVMVGEEDPSSCERCGGSSHITQEDDVLDTWFSSWLWPFSTMGWPDSTPTLAKFYPTDVLVTGPDIIFFWVARMVMAGYFFENKCPFHDVYFTSIVRDMKGRKMSKSLGNSPDPIEIIEKYGADALRFTVVSLAPVGQDIRFASEKVELGRNFANKLWNASRFILMNMGDAACTIKDAVGVSDQLSVWDRWILSRGMAAIETVRSHLSDSQYKFNEAVKTAYEFIWNDLCDNYIEMSKPSLNGSDPLRRKVVQKVLLKTLDLALRVLHPFMPYITEEIWQKLPGAEGMLMVSEFPKVDHKLVNVPLETEIQDALQAVKVVRNLRSAANIPPGKKVTVRVIKSEGMSPVFERHSEMIKWLAAAEVFEIVNEKTSGHLVGLMGETEVCLSLAGLIDVPAEKKRVETEIAKIEKEKAKIAFKLADQAFVSKAPPEVVDRIRQGVDGYALQLNKLQSYLKELEAI